MGGILIYACLVQALSLLPNLINEERSLLSVLPLILSIEWIGLWEKENRSCPINDGCAAQSNFSGIWNIIYQIERHTNHIPTGSS